jgi:hypothetical protein
LLLLVAFVFLCIIETISLLIKFPFESIAFTKSPVFKSIIDLVESSNKVTKLSDEKHFCNKAGSILNKLE